LTKATARRAVRLGVLLCAALALGACRAKEDASSEAAAYARPQGWGTECVGRFQVDLPFPLSFGEARPEFSADASGRYLLDDEKNSFFNGRMSVADVAVLEGTAIEGLTRFGPIDRRADAHFEIKIIRDGGPEEQEPARAAITTKQPWREPRSFIWRAGNTFDFGIYVPSDQRPRMLHGELSGTGSPAQAKAVVDALWPRYRPRKPGEMPSDAGICTPYGFFADPKGATERDYVADFNVRYPAHSNLVIGFSVSTRLPATGPGEITATRLEDLPTPWAIDDKIAADSKANCRPQQGTASRDLFGCTFAGVKTIKSHREPQYLMLPNGQRARLVVVEYYASLQGAIEYEVSLSALGALNSATEPYLFVNARGIPAETKLPSMRGKKPPPIDEAVQIVLGVARSLQLRPGAVDPSSKVKDTLEGVR
jgi:hypothetical protein